MNEDDALWRRLVFSVDHRNPTPAARYHLTVIGAAPRASSPDRRRVWARESRWWSGMPWEETA